MHADRGGQTAHAGVLLLRSHTSLLNQTLQTLADAGLPPLKGCLALIVQNDLIASLDGSLCDTTAHQTRTDDKNFADFHFDLLLFIHNGDARALNPEPASAETGALPLFAERFSHSAVGILSQCRFLCLGQNQNPETDFQFFRRCMPKSPFLWQSCDTAASSDRRIQSINRAC